MGFFLGARKLVSGGELGVMILSGCRFRTRIENTQPKVREIAGFGVNSKAIGSLCKRQDTNPVSSPDATSNQFHTPQSGLSLESLFMRLLLGRGRFIAVR
jgi:hypothetical protein